MTSRRSRRGAFGSRWSDCEEPKPLHGTAPANSTCDEYADSRKGEIGAVRRSPKLVGGEGAGWRWINWVREELRDGTIAVNAEGVWLHDIAGAAYVELPYGFEAFAML